LVVVPVTLAEDVSFVIGTSFDLRGLERLLWSPQQVGELRDRAAASRYSAGRHTFGPDDRADAASAAIAPAHAKQTSAAATEPALRKISAITTTPATEPHHQRAESPRFWMWRCITGCIPGEDSM
jgi:septal ring-binding cell division protein DamX